VLMVERVLPVAVLVQERVVSSTQVGAVGDAGRAAVFPGVDVVDVAPRRDDLTAGSQNPSGVPRSDPNDMLVVHRTYQQE
jgi:hypothetical protein